MPIVVEVEEVSKKAKAQDVSNEKVDKKVVDAPKYIAPIPRPPRLFPQSLAKKINDGKFDRFYDI